MDEMQGVDGVAGTGQVLENELGTIVIPLLKGVVYRSTDPNRLTENGRRHLARRRAQ